MKLSAKLMSYNYFVLGFIPYVTSPTGIARYGLSTSQVTALTNFLADWILKFGAYSDPTTHSSTATLDVNEAYLIGFPLTEGVRAAIKSDNTLDLSGIERQVLNIKKPVGRRSHVKPPTYGPSFVALSYVAGILSMLAVDPTTPRSFGKPEGTDIGLLIAYTDAGAPLPEKGDYMRLPNETAAEFEIIVGGANANKLLSLMGTYVNARGEESVTGIIFRMLV